MSVIYNRTFATGDFNYLSLSTADYTRAMSIGSNWSRIRIGILCSMGTLSETAWRIRSCSLSIGVCKGSAGWSQLAPVHAIGIGLPHNAPSVAAGIDFVYNAGSAGNSYFSTTSFSFYRSVQGVLGTSGTSSFTTNIASNTALGGALARRSILILDLKKSALNVGNMTQGIFGGATGHMALDITSSDLYSALENWVGAPTVQGVALNALGLGNSLAFDEVTDGAFDNVSIFWSNYSPFQLYEVAVYRVA